LTHSDKTGVPDSESGLTKTEWDSWQIDKKSERRAWMIGERGGWGRESQKENNGLRGGTPSPGFTICIRIWHMTQDETD